MSPVSADPQFQVTARYPADLDRCRRCGNPRKLHGSDGACGIAFFLAGFFTRRTRAGLAAIGAVTAVALGAAVWLLVSTTTHDLSSAAAFSVLAVVILLLGGLSADGRRH